MSALAFLLICFQACLVHNALAAIGPLGYAGAPGACGCGAGFQGPYGVGPIGAWEAGLEGFGYGAGYLGRGFGLAGPVAGFEVGYPGYPGYPGYFGFEGCAAYGGAGVGNCAVAGELPVGGSTVVAGQVPIIGAVEYGGFVPAAGAVTISGNCACGCGGPYAY